MVALEGESLRPEKRDGGRRCSPDPPNLHRVTSPPNEVIPGLVGIKHRGALGWPV